MRFLLTNDDGIDATGLTVLADVCREFGDVVVVAPDGERSGTSHSTTTSRPLKIDRRGDGLYATDGSPADCVRVGLAHLLDDVDWVIAGINRGGNLGVDIHLSGTVAAAREAAMMGARALAISQFMVRGRELTPEGMGARARRVLESVLELSLPERSFLNANLPHPVPCGGDVELVRCAPDPSPLPIAFAADEGGLRFAGSYHDRARRDGHDVAVCFGGAISLSHLTAGWEHHH